LSANPAIEVVELEELDVELVLAAVVPDTTAGAVTALVVIGLTP
jgi:hypothetical protein